MNNKKNLASLRAAAGKNFLALKFIIESFGLKSSKWTLWQNNLGDSLEIHDDGQKLNYKFKFKELNDILQYSSLKNILNYSSLIIGLKTKNNLKFFAFGKDNFVRLLIYDKEWKMHHLFSESSFLIIQIVNSFVTGSDINFNKLNVEDIIILNEPFEKTELPNINNNFLMFFKEIEGL